MRLLTRIGRVRLLMVHGALSAALAAVLAGMAGMLAGMLAGVSGCASSMEQARARHEAAPWRPPGETLADSSMSVNAIQAIYRLDDLRAERCERRRFVDTDLVQTKAGTPPAPGSHWVERWTMDRCGKRVAFLVEFSPDPTGGTGVTARFE